MIDTKAQNRAKRISKRDVNFFKVRSLYCTPLIYDPYRKAVLEIYGAIHSHVNKTGVQSHTLLAAHRYLTFLVILFSL